MHSYLEAWLDKENKFKLYRLILNSSTCNESSVAGLKMWVCNWKLFLLVF